MHRSRCHPLYTASARYTCRTNDEAATVPRTPLRLSTSLLSSGDTRPWPVLPLATLPALIFALCRRSRLRSPRSLLLFTNPSIDTHTTPYLYTILTVVFPQQLKATLLNRHRLSNKYIATTTDHHVSLRRAEDASHWRVQAAHWTVRSRPRLDTTPLASKANVSDSNRYIDGKWVEGVDKKKFEVINPSTEEVITSVCEATEKDVDIAVAAARKAFEGSWKKVTPNERGRMLLKFADILEKNTDLLAAVEALDNGKSFTMAKGDVGAVVGCIRYYGGWADKIEGKTHDIDPNMFHYSRAEPVSLFSAQIPPSLFSFSKSRNTNFSRF